MSSITTEEEAVAAVDDDAEEVVVQTPVEVFRNEYAPLDLIVAKINMDFQIFSGKTFVESELTIQPNPKLVSLSFLIFDISIVLCLKSQSLLF